MTTIPNRSLALGRKLLLASLVLLACAAPAHALAWKMAYSYYEVEGIGIGFRIDPYSHEPVSAQMCIQHDTQWNPYVPWTGNDDDGYYSVWVPFPDSSAGSEKANASCVDAPPDGVGGPLPDLPGGVQVS